MRLRSSKPFLMTCHFEMKACRRCGEEKDLSAFYKHSRMTDGHLHICKVCIRKQRQEHRANNPHVQEYDRKRGQLPHRKQQLKRLSQRQTDLGRRPAQNAVCNAVRDGKLLRPNNCSACGKACTPEGHHDDYSKPLEVRWLCRSCHCKVHAKVTV